METEGILLYLQLPIIFRVLNQMNGIYTFLPYLFKPIVI
jgi:hypothetical protein